MDEVSITLTAQEAETLITMLSTVTVGPGPEKSAIPMMRTIVSLYDKVEEAINSTKAKHVTVSANGVNHA